MSKNEERISKKNVERLLKELYPSCTYGEYQGPLYAAHKEADVEMDKLRADFERSPAYLKAKKKVKETREAHDKEVEERRTRLREVRQLYYATGLTEEVQERLLELVKEFNGARDRRKK